MKQAMVLLKIVEGEVEFSKQMHSDIMAYDDGARGDMVRVLH
jgi:hypothetical protein